MKKIYIWIFGIVMYCLIVSTGFTIIKSLGYYYFDEKIYAYALPMMIVLAGFVLWINKKFCYLSQLYQWKLEKTPGASWMILLMPLLLAAICLEAFIFHKFEMKIFVITILTFLIGFCEESFFRGFIITYGEKYFSSKLFLLAVSTVSFGLLHMVNITSGMAVKDAWMQSLNAVPFGFVAGLIFLERKNLWAIIFWHMFYDFSLFIGADPMYYSVLVAGFIVDILFAIETLKLVILYGKKFMNWFSLKKLKTK